MRITRIVQVLCVVTLVFLSQSSLWGDDIYVGTSTNGGTVTRINPSGIQTVIKDGTNVIRGLEALPNGNVVFGTDFAANNDPGLRGTLYTYNPSTGITAPVTGGFLTFYDIKALSNDNVCMLLSLWDGAFWRYSDLTGAYYNLNSGHGGPMGKIEGLKNNGEFNQHALYSSSFSGWSLWLHRAEAENAPLLLSGGFGNIDAMGALENGDALVGGVSSAGGLLYRYDAATMTIASAGLSGYGIFYQIEGLTNGDALIAASAEGGSIQYYTASTGSGTNLGGGFGTIEVMKALPNGDALFGATVSGGGLYKYDSTSGTIGVIADANGIGTFYALELLSNGSVVFATSQNGGTVFKYDVINGVLSDYGTGWGVVYDISVHLPSNFNGRAWNPSPADREIDVQPSELLTWSAGLDWSGQTNPNLTAHKVYVSEFEPNLPASLVATVPVGSLTEYDPPTDWKYNTTYYWRVDEVLQNDANTITGNVWRFTVVGSAPEIHTFYNVLTVLEFSPALLSATVTDFDNNVTDVSFALTSVPPGSTAYITNTTTNNYAPTATLTLDPLAGGLHIVQLTVTDAEGNSDVQTAEVNAFASACDAAKAHPNGYTANYFDCDDDCDVDFNDFVEFARQWLSETTLTQPVQY